VIDRQPGGVSGYLIYRVAGGSAMARQFDPNKLAFTGDALPIAERVGGLSASRSGVLVWKKENPQLGQVVWLDAQGKTLAKAGTPEAWSGISLSPDGKRAAVERNGPSGVPAVWTLDLERGVFSRLTSGETSKLRPLWSRGGGRIFFSAGVGDGDIYSIATDGGKEELVLSTPHFKIAWDTSPDESFLLYTELDEKLKQHIWAVPLQGDKTPLQVVGSEFRDWGAKFSLDGRWITYEQSNETGGVQIYVKRFPPTDQRWQISSDGGSTPRWRGDGRQIYYFGAGGRLMVVDLKLGNAVDASRPRQLFVSDRLGMTYDPAPDGKRFLMLQPVASPDSPLNVVVNWPATLLRSNQ
jgi:Tol biopolymer transport system component